MGARYTYGDSGLAAERLGLVAALFEPTTRSFLTAAAGTGPRLALDLGCGPGHTTRLLHEVCRPERTVGLDRSESFVDRASVGAPQGVSFVVHDATVTPFPTSEPDLVYARLLLAHLSDPADVVAKWTAALAPGGRLLIDDLEGVSSQEQAVHAYLTEVAIPVVEREGGRLLVGADLHAMPDPAGTTRIHDGVATFTPPAARSARIFAMNLAVLAERGEVEPRPDLLAELGAIAEGRPAEPVTWRVRQIALRRE